MATGCKKKGKRKGLRTAPACANPSLNINALFPQDTNTGAGDICVYMSISTLCRCTTGKRNLCTYAHLGRLFSTSNLIPRVAPGPLWLPIVLLLASLRHTVLQLPSTVAALCIQRHRYIIHLFINCLSKKITHKHKITAAHTSKETLHTYVCQECNRKLLGYCEIPSEHCWRPLFCSVYLQGRSLKRWDLLYWLMIISKSQ